MGGVDGRPEFLNVFAAGLKLRRDRDPRGERGVGLKLCNVDSESDLPICNEIAFANDTALARDCSQDPARGFWTLLALSFRLPSPYLFWLSTRDSSLLSVPIGTLVSPGPTSTSREDISLWPKPRCGPARPLPVRSSVFPPPRNMDRILDVRGESRGDGGSPPESLSELRCPRVEKSVWGSLGGKNLFPGSPDEGIRASSDGVRIMAWMLLLMDDRNGLWCATASPIGVDNKVPGRPPVPSTILVHCPVRRTCQKRKPTHETRLSARQDKNARLKILWG